MQIKIFANNDKHSQIIIFCAHRVSIYAIKNTFINSK